MAPGAGTAAAGGWVVSSADGLGAAPVGTGKTTEGSGEGVNTAGCAGEETADGITGGIGAAGAGALTGAGAPEPPCAVRARTIAPTASARPPPASASLPQRRRSVARDRKSSHGSAPVSSGAAVGGLGTSLGTALVATGGRDVSSAIRSRSARNSSIAKIWSESDSSTTSPNGARRPCGAEVYLDGRVKTSRCRCAVQLPGMTGIGSRCQHRHEQPR